MKKKIFISILSLVLMFGLSACGKKEEQAKEQVQKAQKNQAEKLIDWLQGGEGTECQVKTPQGDIVVKSKDQKVRMDGVPYLDMSSAGEAPQNGTSLTIGDWVYMWSGEKGTKMNIKEIAGEEKTDSDFDKEDYSWEDWAENMEEQKANYDCVEKRLSDDVFTVPEDVEFVDLSAMKEGLQDLGNDLSENSDSMSTEDMQAQLDKIMQNAGTQ